MAAAARKTQPAEPGVVEKGAAAKPKKRKRVGAKAPEPICVCDWCPRPLFKQEDIEYVTGTDLRVCKPCKENGKKGLGLISQAFGALVGHIRSRA